MENLSAQHQDSSVMSTKEWALTIFLSSLPLIGFILLIVWAFDSNTNIHKKNWAKGSLLIVLIGILFVLSFLFLFGGLALIAGLSS